MKIGGFVKTSLSDFPGHISAVIFTSGCNLRCPCCHNPDLVTHPDTEVISSTEALDFLASKKNRLTGVVVTGGEPLLHGDLIQLIEQIHHFGYAVKIDTNGTCPRMLETVIDSGWCSYVAMDVKSSPDDYDRAAGKHISLEAIRESIALIKASTLAHEFRTTVVPGMHSVKTIAGIGSLIGFTSRYALQNFSGRRTLSPSLNGLSGFREHEMNAFGKIARDFCDELIIR